MKISAKAIVSNSDILRNYKTCREKAEVFGKILVMKNNQPDAVLFSCAEYEKFSAIIERIESIEPEERSLIFKEIEKLSPSD